LHIGSNLPPKDNLRKEDKSSAPKVSFIRRFHCSVMDVWGGGGANSMVFCLLMKILSSAWPHHFFTTWKSHTEAGEGLTYGVTHYM